MDANQALGILGLGADATADEIKDVYRDLTKVWHPDRFTNDPRLQQRAEEKFKVINEAYQVLQGHSFRPIIETSSTRVTPAHQGPPEHSRITEPDWRRVSARAPVKSGVRPAFWAYALIGVAVMGSVEYAVWRQRMSGARNSPSTRQASPSSPPQQYEAIAGPAKSEDVGMTSTLGTPLGVDSEGQSGTKSQRRTRRELRSDPPSSMKENGAGSDTRSRPTTRSEESLSSGERSSLKAACAQANSSEGTAADNRCVEDHLARLASAPHRPDLSNLSEPERQSIESACSKAKYLYGPAAYNQCLQEKFVRWTTAQPRPDLSGLTTPERESIEEACSQTKYFDGPKEYNGCLREQLARLAITPDRPDLSGLTVPERESIEAVCSQATHPAGPAEYNSCLIKQMSLLKDHH